MSLLDNAKLEFEKLGNRVTEKAEHLVHKAKETEDSATENMHHAEHVREEEAHKAESEL